MSKRLAVLVALASIAALVIGVTIAGAATSSKIRASMNGKQEVTKGASNGKGTFTGTFRGGKLCYTLTISGVSSPNAAHIHKGARGKDGAVVIDLKPTFKSGKSSKCVAVKASVAKAIKAKPAGFYANVHNKSFPNGAIRGQLTAG